MLRDLRYALRSLSKSPGFVLVATVCLGLALALNTTTFAMLDALRHRSLPVRDRDRLFEVYMWGRGAGSDVPSWERYAVLREGRFHQGLALWSYEWGVTVRAGEDVSEQAVVRVSGNFFALLGVQAEQGRILGPGSPDSWAVVNHDLWERSLGGRSLDGLTIWIAGREYQVVGILPSDMRYPPSEIWVPLPEAAERTGAGLGRHGVVAKLKPGLTPETVRPELATLASRLTMEYGSGPVPFAFTLKSIVPDPMNLEQIHFAMMGAALLVFVIACANLAGLMLVRGVAKRRELALRMALGAERGTVVRQLLAESVVVMAIGAALGLLITVWAIAMLRSQMPPYLREIGLIRPQPSWRVFLAGLGGAALTLLLFGLGPAIRASDVEVSEPLKDASAGATGRRRWRYSPLVIGEVALSLVLVMGAVLLTRAAGRMADSMLGYDRSGLLQAWVWRGPRVPGKPDTVSVARLSHDLSARVAAIPGVRSVAVVSRGNGTAPVMSEFYDGVNGLLPRAALYRVGGSFLPTLGVPILRGRNLLPGERAMVVDEIAARALWPDGAAVGQLIKLGGPKDNEPWWPVVGVARQAMVSGPEGDPFLPPVGAVYQGWQPERRDAGWVLAIRTTGLEPALAVALRQAISDAFPGGRALWVEPWLSDFDAEVRAHYLLVRVFGGFSAFALLLAGIGLYGVVSYTVSQRMREFAVRIAVGAPQGDVMRLVAHDATVMILAGTGMGAFLAMWGSTLLGDWLYNVYHTDAMSLIVAELVLFAAAAAACLQPALRAVRANPVEILRAI
jgi:predicted permease